MAAAANQPLTQYVAGLVEQERRRQMVADLRASVERLRAEPVAWAAYQADLGELDALAGDGVRDDDADWEFLATATW
ncbi:MAG: hypothetical protein ACRDI2_05430 [Chloroflexota bacterium]